VARDFFSLPAERIFSIIPFSSFRRTTTHSQQRFFLSAPRNEKTDFVNDNNSPHGGPRGGGAGAPPEEHEDKFRENLWPQYVKYLLLLPQFVGVWHCLTEYGFEFASTSGASMEPLFKGNEVFSYIKHSKGNMIFLHYI